MPQPVAHTADIAPRLTWHEFLGLRPETNNGLADPLDASFYSIARPFVLLERLTVQGSEIACDPFGVLNDMVEAVCRIVPRRQSGGLALHWPARESFRPAQGEFRLDDQGFR